MKGECGGGEEDEVDLRAYQPAGGPILVRLLEMPPPPKTTNNWTIRRGVFTCPSSACMSVAVCLSVCLSVCLLAFCLYAYLCACPSSLYNHVCLSRPPTYIPSSLPVLLSLPSPPTHTHTHTHPPTHTRTHTPAISHQLTPYPYPAEVVRAPQPARDEQGEQQQQSSAPLPGSSLWPAISITMK